MNRLGIPLCLTQTRNLDGTECCQLSIVIDEPTKMQEKKYGSLRYMKLTKLYSEIIGSVEFAFAKMKKNKKNKEQNRASNRHGDNLILVWRFFRKNINLFCSLLVGFFGSRITIVRYTYFVIIISARLPRNLFYFILKLFGAEQKKSVVNIGQWPFHACIGRSVGVHIESMNTR